MYIYTLIYIYIYISIYTYEFNTKSVIKCLIVTEVTCLNVTDFTGWSIKFFFIVCRVSFSPSKINYVTFQE